MNLTSRSLISSLVHLYIWAVSGCAGVVIVCSVPRAQALDIQVSRSVVITEPVSLVGSAADPGSAKLDIIMEAAAEYWENIILDPGTLTITYTYRERTTGLANATVTAVGLLGRPAAAHINVDTINEGGPGLADDTDMDWFYDLDPTTNEHWNMRLALYRDLTSGEQQVRFDTNSVPAPPDLLEVSYRGTTNATASADAISGNDLFTSLLHEIGHCLGLAGSFSGAIAQTGDNDYDIDGHWMNGQTWDAEVWINSDGDAEVGHLAWDQGGVGRLNNPLMCGDCAETGARRLPSAVDILAVATAGSWLVVDLPRQDFLAGSDWHTAGNWAGDQLPDADDAAFIRHEGVVTMSADASVDSLYVGHLGRVFTGTHMLEIDNLTELQDDIIPTGGGVVAKPEIQVDLGGEFVTRDLLVGDGARLELDGGTADIEHDLDNNGEVSGHGTLFVDSLLVNNGTIRATGGLLELETDSNAAPWDLDGDSALNEPGALEALTGDIRVVRADHIGDFDGTMTVGDGQFIEMTSNETWTLGTTGELRLHGGPLANDADRAKLKGGQATLRGRVEVDEEAAIEAKSIFASAVDVELNDADDRLAVFGSDRMLIAGGNTEPYSIGCTIESGATFTGQGVLINGMENVLDLKDGANVGVKLSNGGAGLRIANRSIGTASVAELNQLDIGVLDIDIRGTSSADLLEVSGEADLGGTLNVAFSGFIPAFGRWTIINAASVSDVFGTVNFIDAPASTTPRIEYFADHVDVVLSRAVFNLELPRILLDGGLHAGHAPIDIPPFTGADFEVTGVRFTSSNPAVLKVTDSKFVPGEVGEATVRMEWIDSDGARHFEEREVVVAAQPVNPACPPLGLTAQLLAPDGAPSDTFGGAVSVSGGTVLGGAPQADIGPFANAGAAYVFRRDPVGTWRADAKLTLPPGTVAAGDSFGAAVSLDGTIAAVGAPGRNGQAGEVFLFGRSPAGAWSMRQRIAPAVLTGGDRFGSTLAVQRNTLLIGAPGDDTNGIDAGAVYAYRLSGASFNPEVVFYGSDSVAGDHFGSALALSGANAVVGAPNHSSLRGAAYVFDHIGAGNWSETAKLEAGAGVAGDLFGTSVAIGTDPTVAIGAPGADAAGVGVDSGAAYVFTSAAGGAWIQEAELFASNAAAGDRFGSSIGLDGCKLVIGSPLQDVARPDGGATYVFSNTALGLAGWSENAILTAPDSRPGDFLGRALDISGGLLAVGAPSDNDQALDAGSVYVWEAGALPGAGNQFKDNRDFRDWTANHFGPDDKMDGDPKADDDRDGASRIWEYFHGLDPNAAERLRGSWVEWQKDADGKPQASFFLRIAKRARRNLQFNVEVSENGRFWSDVEGDAEWIADEGDNELLGVGVDVDGRDTVSQRYFRLRLKQNVPRSQPDSE